MAKRAFDIVFSALGLAALGWLILVLALVVRLGTPGPGIFAQERVGRHGRGFTCYKLRTMYRETRAAASHHTSVASVTKLGRWLRGLKLDELPQLWNVLTGEMSFVGPRPCLPMQVELIEVRRALGVLAIRPGITGKAQVMGVDMSDPQRLARLDAEYARERSFAGDLVLIVRTVVGGGRGDRVDTGAR